jgi:hypothetical protein
MAGELVREGRLEAVPDPRTAAVGDPRTYLYVEISKRTRPTNTGQGAVGVAVGVRLRDDPTVYRSDHGIADRAIERDGPAATAVELPSGTRAEDIAEITAWRVPMSPSDGGGVVTVTQLQRAFLLDAAYLPQPSLARWEGTAVLTRDAPTATVWSRAG